MDVSILWGAEKVAGLVSYRGRYSVHMEAR